MEEELCIVDSGTTNTILREMKYFQTLKKEEEMSGILPGYSCKEGERVEDGLLLEFPCTPTRTRSV
jgi:hypothetical protein